MASTVDVWNLALGLVGDGFVIDPLENSTGADLCRLHYPYALGFAIYTASPQDLSEYPYLFVSLRTSELDVSVVEIGIFGPDTAEPKQTWYALNLSGKRDGEWHQYAVNILEHSNLTLAENNLAAVTAMFTMRIKNLTTSSNWIDFDDIFFSDIDPSTL